MYSLLPAAVSILFLGYGIYVLAVKGFTAVTLCFFALCVSTFLWQFSWAVLFQVHDPELAGPIIKFGYLVILFLPTTLYHFLTELNAHRQERPLVYISYGWSAMLAGVLMVSDQFVAGHYNYFWGVYPQAGTLHPLHVLQTLIVTSRGLFITYLGQREALATQRLRLRLCLVSLLIYSFASVDYLCNYGWEVYPVGVIFVAVSLGIIVVAITKYDLLSNPMNLAASMAHEIRTPLATIRAQASGISRYLPILFEGYQEAVKHKVYAPRLRRRELAALGDMAANIEMEVDRSNVIVDLMLAASRMDFLDKSGFESCSARHCLEEALRRYPFAAGMRERVSLGEQEDFRFVGSDTLLIYVLYNLLKNACYAIQAADRGHIDVSLRRGAKGNQLVFVDTATGIPAQVLPHIFDPFYTTKTRGGGTGIGLAFCQRVMTAFGGRISCQSEEGLYTRFILDFPLAPECLGESAAPKAAVTLDASGRVARPGGSGHRRVSSARRAQGVALHLLQDLRRERANLLVVISEHDLLTAHRHRLAADGEAEDEVERALSDVVAVQPALDFLKGEGLPQILLLCPLGDQHAVRLQHVLRDAVVEPALAAYSLPFEVARKIRVGIGVGILEIYLEGVPISKWRPSR